MRPIDFAAARLGLLPKRPSDSGERSRLAALDLLQRSGHVGIGMKVAAHAVAEWPGDAQNQGLDVLEETDPRHSVDRKAVPPIPVAIAGVMMQPPEEIVGEADVLELRASIEGVQP